MPKTDCSLKLRVFFLALGAFGISGCAILTGSQLITVAAEIPDDFPSDGFSHTVFENLLQSYVDTAGHVRYDAWHQSDADVAALESYLAAVSRYSPENAPQRFKTRNDELAYWLYSYNANVIKAILSRWPLDSVTDVKAPLEIVRGLGFFYSQRFLFGEREYNLRSVENDRIRDGFKDPRIHFVLNCGSESCPLIRPELPDGDELEPFLNEAALDFVSDDKNVRIDHENMTIVLNEIFDWFKKDFVNDLRHRGLPTKHGVIDYIATVAPPSMQLELMQAAEYKVSFADYDWSVNDTTTPN